MATIQYTTYTFHKPPLIGEEKYNLIKSNLKVDPSYNPFPIENFYQKFRIEILMYIVGGPIAGILASTEIGFLEVIAGIYAFLLFGGLIGGGLMTASSYLKFLVKRRIYYSRLMKNLRLSEDYFQFRDLML